ncbi:Hypothetical predicted protein [Marmota monax]|uniref:Glycosyltransferase 2-like domain-containing protein n=1 Tax=Marmota monax TaxID=9995 RepID=A0A5E4A8S2_MARMO|nr:Hypothetical predicted protein [Marmota monax]
MWLLLPPGRHSKSWQRSAPDDGDLQGRQQAGRDRAEQDCNVCFTLEPIFPSLLGSQNHQDLGAKASGRGQPSVRAAHQAAAPRAEAPAKPEEAEAEPFTDSSLFAHWGQELSPEGRRVALKQFQYYGYNAYLSDRLPLDRPLPDLRPSGCRNLSFPDSLPEVSIVFIFVNEALSVLLRSIHSAMERTPPHLLKEIILVDDNSSNEELKEKLANYVDKVNGQKPGFIKVVRHSKQEGLIRSRVSGWRAATAPVVALFDAHVEFNVGWAEPVLTRIKENRKRIISPSFDNIKYDNFEIEEYPLAAQGFDWELWCRYLNPPKAWWKLENSTAPIRSPALIGCFIVDRQYFQEIGLLDEGMEVYGGENVELGIRVSGVSHQEG